MINLYCQNCGAPLDATSTAVVITCPFCNASAAPVPKFIERVVERVVVVAAGGQKPGLHCPRCGDGFVEVESRGRRLRVCQKCGGGWLNPETVAHLRQVTDLEIPNAVRIGIGAFAPRDINRNAKLSCPECQQAMTRESLDGLEVDHCDAHGTFFDNAEITRFVEAHRSKRAGVLDDEDLASAGIRPWWKF